MLSFGVKMFSVSSFANIIKLFLIVKIYSNKCCFKLLAAAFAKARDTDKIAFAPNILLLSVASSAIKKLSRVSWLNGFLCFKTASKITVLTLSTAFKTPLPKYLFLSLSLNSCASYLPVLAPDGTAATPTLPFANSTLVSIVGLPRESKISLALMSLINIIIRFLLFNLIITLTENQHSKLIYEKPLKDIKMFCF